MSNKSIDTVLLALIVVVVLSGTWFLGKRHGAREVNSIASSRLSEAEALDIIEQLRVSLAETEQELSDTIRIVEAGKARTQFLQNLLNEQMREYASDAADLALYRSIETSQADAAIEVQSLSWSPAEPSSLMLTLIQWQGRGRVTGDVVIRLQYPAEATASPQAGDSDNTSNSGDLMVDLEPIDFDFRFFQTISVQMPVHSVDAGAGKTPVRVPHSISVTINTADKRLGSRDVLIPWSKVEHTIVD